MANSLEHISDETLQNDLLETVADIMTCETALRMGITAYSKGSVEQRLKSNKVILDIINNEIERRRTAVGAVGANPTEDDGNKSAIKSDEADDLR